MKLSLEKTEVLHIGHQRLTQGDSFVYLGGVLCGDGERYVEEHRPYGTRGEQLNG